MTKAYIDESGTHQGSKVLIVAGYVGSSDAWESIEERFLRADKHAGVAFHAVDCAQGGRDYVGVDKGKRYRLMRKMIKTVNDHDVFGCAEGVWIEDYDAVFPRNGQHWETWLGQPYDLAFGGLAIELCNYVKRAHPGEKFSIVVEDSQHWYPIAAKLFLRIKNETAWPGHILLETIASRSPKEAVQLYAPDILAYETYLMKQRERYPTKHAPREYMLELLTKRKEGRMWQKEIFEKMKADPTLVPLLAR